ncbi:hypothetical protein ABG808_09635 [Streptococcus iniae]
MDSLDKIKVYPILESLDFIIDNNASVARFGDGEIDIMSSIVFLIKPTMRLWLVNYVIFYVPLVMRHF